MSGAAAVRAGVCTAPDSFAEARSCCVQAWSALRMTGVVRCCRQSLLCLGMARRGAALAGVWGEVFEGFVGDVGDDCAVADFRDVLHRQDDFFVKEGAAADYQAGDDVGLVIDEDAFDVSDVPVWFVAPDGGVVEDVALERGLREVLGGDGEAGAQAGECGGYREADVPEAARAGFFARLFGGRDGEEVLVLVKRELAEVGFGDGQVDGFAVGLAQLLDVDADDLRATETGLREVRAGVDGDVRNAVVARVEDDGVEGADLLAVGAVDVAAVAEVFDACDVRARLLALIRGLALLGECAGAFAGVLGAKDGAGLLGFEAQAVFERHVAGRASPLP